MDRKQILAKLDATLEEWELARTWGTIEMEFHDGVAVLLRKETKEKFTATGGHKNVPGRESI
jgi:hypothetical protein